MVLANGIDSKMMPREERASKAVRDLSTLSEEEVKQWEESLRQRRRKYHVARIRHGN